MSEPASFAARQVANMLAVRAMRHATCFLNGETDPAKFAEQSDQLQLELLTADAAASSLLDPVRVLNIAMLRLARSFQDEANDDGRKARWMTVTGALVELVADELVRFGRPDGGRA